MQKEHEFKITEYADGNTLDSSIIHTTVKAKNIDDGIKKFLDEKSSNNSRYIICGILQNNNAPFKHFTFGERKNTNTSQYVTNIHCAMIRMK